MQTPTAQALPAKAGMILQVKDVRTRGEELNGQLVPAIARCGGGMCNWCVHQTSRSSPLTPSKNLGKSHPVKQAVNFSLFFRLNPFIPIPTTALQRSFASGAHSRANSLPPSLMMTASASCLRPSPPSHECRPPQSGITTRHRLVKGGCNWLEFGGKK
jgi:hypothetical protein